MQFKGIITAAMPIATGTSRSGKEWKRASYILTYDKSNEQYPKSVLFDIMGDRIEQLNIQQGKEYEIEIDFSTREYNGRIYMSASAWKATEIVAGLPTQTDPQSTQSRGWEQLLSATATAPVSQPAQTQSDNNDGLPF